MRQFSKKKIEAFYRWRKEKDGVSFILKFMRENGIKRRHIALTVGLNAIAVAFESLGLSLLLPIGEYVISLAKNNTADPGQIWSYLENVSKFFGVTISIYHIIWLLVLSIIGRQIVTFLRVELGFYYQALYLKYLRQRMIELFYGMDVEGHDKAETGAFVNSITTEARYSFGLPTILELTHTVGLLVSLVIILLFTSVTLTGLSVCSFLFVVFLFRGMSNSMASAAAALIKSNSDFSQHLLQRLKSIKQIKIDQIEGFEKTKVDSILDRQSSAVRRVGRLTAIMETAIEPLILLSAVCIFGVISVFYDIELVRVGFFIIIVGRMTPLFKSFLVGWQSIVRTRVSILALDERIRALISSQEQDSGHKSITDETISKIQFKDVAYLYKSPNAETKIHNTNQSKLVLDGINLELQKGELVGIVGESGCGKSTLVELLLGLRKPDKGEILINDEPLGVLRRNQYLSKIGFVSQSPAFFEGTIRENLLGNLTYITEESLIEAARFANALDFIMARPGGFDNKIMEYGGGLSVGQRQRLDITRALIRKPEVLVFDEPTSSIDVESAELIRSAIWHIQSRKDRIILVVTHNHDFLEGFDKIIKMSNGTARIHSQNTGRV